MVRNHEEVARRLKLDSGPKPLEKGQAFMLVSGANTDQDDAFRGAPLAIHEFAEIQVAGEKDTR